MPTQPRITKHSPFLFTVPAYTLVVKFLSHHYEVDPFVLRGGGQGFNPYSVFLNGQLERYRHVDTKVPLGYRRLTNELTLSVSHCKQDSGLGHHLTPHKIWVFNEFCRHSFLRQMVGEVKLRREFGERIDQSIELFLDRYGIEEDVLSIDTATRYYHRIVAVNKLARI